LLHWLTTALARWQSSLFVCIPAVINSRKAQGKVLLPWVEMSKRSPHLAAKQLDRLHSRTGTSQGLSLPLLHYKWCPGTGFSLSWDLVLCGVSVHMFVHVRVQAKNSNRTTVRMFSYFNLLHTPSLSFRSYVNMHSWCFSKHHRNPKYQDQVSDWLKMYTLWLVCWLITFPPWFQICGLCTPFQALQLGVWLAICHRFQAPAFLSARRDSLLPVGK